MIVFSRLTFENNVLVPGGFLNTLDYVSPLKVALELNVDSELL